jgi:hypothetical protein
MRSSATPKEWPNERHSQRRLMPGVGFVPDSASTRVVIVFSCGGKSPIPVRRDFGVAPSSPARNRELSQPKRRDRRDVKKVDSAKSWVTVWNGS